MCDNSKDKDSPMNATLCDLVGGGVQNDPSPSPVRVAKKVDLVKIKGEVLLGSDASSDGSSFSEIRQGAHLRSKEILSRFIVKKNAEFRAKNLNIDSR
ncbi:hypothetical protein [Niveispirillum cyanobacteriorum]|uniref:hypothetical protein n=1 Tax=Niveispirillum cyanobacteriorum TaxID=1612173 RepID=UPI0016636D6D|nr:hypothetical protein [Niveispirillum cyanobacteriorum]GGE66501.1 hypothetical protein GCM10011317_24780 [Niveispirillum cyanobacteriorum]